MYLGRGAGPAGFCRLFALKTIHAQLAADQDFVRMFLDEARLAGRIHHPNAVPVYEVGTDQGRHFIAMDYVNGETLTEALVQTQNDNGLLPASLVLFVLEGVCEALHTAHELTDGHGDPLGVVHRDVSPHNILIGYDGVPRITDFGVAKAADRLTQTQSGIQKGKLAYMAPEQLGGRPVDRRVDIFALGVILWECLVGQRLFKRNTHAETIRALHDFDVPSVLNRRADLPPSLARVVSQALAKAPDERYETARALGRDLRAIAVEEGLLASTADLEHYMRSAFPDSYARRQAIAQRALQGGPATGPDEAIQLSDNSLSPTVPMPDDSFRTPPSVLARVAKALVLLTTCVVVAAMSAIMTVRWRGPPSPTSAASNAIVVPTVPAAPASLRSGASPVSVAAASPPASVSPPASASPAAAAAPPAAAIRRDTEAVDTRTLPSPASAVPARIDLTFEVAPANALIRVEGRRVVGRRLSLLSSPKAVRVVASAPGYRKQSQLVVPDRDQRVALQLKRRFVRAKKKRTPPKPSSHKKNGPLLVTGDDL